MIPRRGSGVLREAEGQPPAQPRLIDGGGPVLRSVGLHLVYWGSAWCADQRPDAGSVSDAVTRLFSTAYLEPLGQYRGAGPARVAHSMVVCASDPPSPHSIDVVARFLSAAMAAGDLAQPDASARLYLVVMPPGARPDRAGVAGEHGVLDYAPGVPAHFAWASSAGGLDPLTLRISHLVVNALTDPEGDSIRFADEGPGDEWLEVASLCSTPLRLQGVAARGYWSRTHGRCLTTADFDRGAGPVRRLLEPAPPAAAGAPLAATARTGGGNQARDSGAATPATALPPVRIAIAHLPPRPEVRPGEDSPYLAGLSATAVLVPPVAIAVTALALIAAVSPAGIQSRFAGPVIGGVVALAAWLAGGLWSARLAISRLANSDEYGQVRLRLEELRPRLNCLIDSGASSIPPAAAESLLAARDLAAMLDEDLSIPGIRWVVAHGFIGAWMTIHRAEEALFIADDVGRIISEGLVDELRLEDSGMDHSDELLNWVRRALRALSPASADRYLHVPDGNAANSADEGIGVDRQDVARNVLRTARRVINEYRDEIWSGLIRARNQLQRTVLFSGILAYALVVLMPFAGLDSAALAAASVFFIFGALVGMIARLRLESGANKAVEDFGLETTRLMAAPLLSGLAAIFGVLLLGLAHVQLAGLSLGPAPPSGQAVPTLNQIFSLAGNPAGFLGAAIFGLTPSLLLDYLQTETKALKEALRITEATGAPPAKTAVQPQGGTPGGTG